MAPAEDEEVQLLLASVRSLVNQAHGLSRSINNTIEELAEFASDLKRAQATTERRMSDLPFEGDDRRGRASDA